MPLSYCIKLVTAEAILSFIYQHGLISFSTSSQRCDNQRIGYRKLSSVPTAAESGVCYHIVNYIKNFSKKHFSLNKILKESKKV